MEFKPRQISNFKSNPAVGYEIFSPSVQFAEDIVCFWRLNGVVNRTDFEYLILPDTCIDIILEAKGDKLLSPIISRPFADLTIVQMAGAFDYWGVRFKPGKIMQYLWFELAAVTTDFKSIDIGTNEFSSITEFTELFKLYSPGKYASKFAVYNYDPEQIMSVALSDKQKSRLFKQLSGYNINTYKKIQKFHASLGDPYAHFYDQSHYIKTFKELTGHSPKRFDQKFNI